MDTSGPLSFIGIYKQFEGCRTTREQLRLSLDEGLNKGYIEESKENPYVEYSTTLNVYSITDEGREAYNLTMEKPKLSGDEKKEKMSSIIADLAKEWK